MGLKDRARKLITEQLRPWLVCDVFPIINFSASELSLQLPYLEFDVEALNRAGMASSPLVVKEAVKVEKLQLTFAPFRQPVLAIVVKGLHVVLEPRSPEDVWWEKQREKTAEQTQIAALHEIDPQGASVHTAAEGLAEGEAGSSLIARFLTSLVLSSVRLEFHDCSLRLVSQIYNERQHLCHIPLSSLEFGDGNDTEGYTWSGGLLVGIMSALRGVWKNSTAPTMKDCFVKGLGLQVEVLGKERDLNESDSDETHKESGVADIDEIAQQYLSGQHSSSQNGGMTIYAKPEDFIRKRDNHVVLLEDLVLGFRFRDLGVDALEFDTPEAAFGFDFEEMYSLKILAAQIQGPSEESLIKAQEKRSHLERFSESENISQPRRSPTELWKKGIQGAMELSSHRRLTRALQTGISRRRYSSLYESWLLELGWGQRRGGGADRERSKSQLARINGLSKDISETQKKLPLEAIALARRVARRRVLAAIHSTEEDTNVVNQTAHSRNTYLQFQAFMSSFWSMIVMVIIFMQGKATGLSMWLSAAQRLGVSEWKSIRDSLRGISRKAARSKDEPAVAIDVSQSISRLEHSQSRIENGTCSQKRLHSRAVENYFQLQYEEEEECGVLRKEKKEWTMTYSLKIRRGSITLASGAIGVLEKGKGTDPRSKGVELDSALVPAIYISLEKIMLAYGSTANASGASIACGSLSTELLSILPEQLPKKLSAKLNSEVIQKEFSSVGRWAAKVDNRGLLLSSCPCPQQRTTGIQTIGEVPLANGIYQKHWIWQDRQLEVWDRSWALSTDAQAGKGQESTIPGLDLEKRLIGDDRPFLIAEFNSLDDELSTDDSPGDLIKCSLAMGQLKLTLKGSFLTRIRLLQDQLMVSKTSPQTNSNGTKMRQHSQSGSTSSLEKFWDDNYNQYLDVCRESMIAAIPEKCVRFSAVVDGPQLRLFASASEIRNEGDADMSQSEKDSNMGASVVVDFGRLELAFWPPQKKEIGGSGGSPEMWNVSQASNEWWNRAVDSKLWLKRPPVPVLPRDFAEKKNWEHEQVGNNLYISIEGVALILELHKERLKELPILGPLALVIESSLCWDQYSSLFSASKSVSASVSVKILSLSVQSYIREVSIALQVIGFYAEAFESPSVPDSTLVVRGGDSSLSLDVIVQEELAQLSANRKESDGKSDSSLPSGEEAPFTICALTVSVELEDLKFVLGDSRQEDGYPSSNKSAAGVQAQMRQDVGLRYEPREKKLQSVDEDNTDVYSWEPNAVDAEIGKEAYILIHDVLLHISLGDGEQFCMFSGIKDVLMRLVDSGSVSSTSDLAEIRSHFFKASISESRFPSHLSGFKSFSGLVLTEFALEYLSLKAFGPSTHHDAVDEGNFQNQSGVRKSDSTQSILDARTRDTGSGASQSKSTDLGDQNASVDQTGLTSKSLVELTTEDKSNCGEQHTPSNLRRGIDSGSKNDETHWLAANLEMGKVLVSDGSLDALVAKVVLVANGAESFQLDVGVDRKFQKAFLGTQGGLVLVHTEALATLVQFFEDVGRLVAKPADLTNNLSEATQEPSGDHGDGGPEEIRQMPSLSSTYRSSSVPAPSTEKRGRKVKRTSSAPPKANAPVAKRSGAAVSPKFEGTVSSEVSGFSLVLARHSVKGSVPAEGVLFELESSAMFEVGNKGRRAKFDLSRFTILGLQARVPGNARKTLGRTNTRTPQFGASFKAISGPAVQSLSGQTDQLKEPPMQGSLSSDQKSNSPREASSTEVGGLLRPNNQSNEPIDQPNTTLRDQSSADKSRNPREEEIVSEDIDAPETDKPKDAGSITKQAEGYHEALSEFNSFILERLSVHCAVEKVSDEGKVWKWTDAWQGQCSITGLNVAVTTSEIQLIESLVGPLSMLGGSSTSTVVDSVAEDPVEGVREDADEGDFEIPDGAIIAIKDVREHCYLAAEEIPTSRGNFRLVGVLHYSLVDDKALFKVKYQDGSTKNSWFSLLSIHAKRSNGEPFRMHYRSGSGLAGISSTNDGSSEQWRFVPVETSKDGDSTDLDIRNPTYRHLFHLLNQKGKSGIAFEENVPVMVQQPGNPFKVKIVAMPPKPDTASPEALTQTDETPLPLPPLGDKDAAGLVTAIPHVICTFDTFLFTILHEAAGGLHLLPLLRAQIPGTEGVVQVGLSKTRTIFQCSMLLEYYEAQSSLWVSILNPIETDVFYRARSTTPGFTATNNNKTPVAFFSRLRKVDFVISEPSLDACLFLIGALDLAGPYTVRYSPVRANRCLVENHTGVDVLCRFDQGSSKVDGMIPSWHSDVFLMRHMTSRRDTGPAKVASSLELFLQKPGKGATSPMLVTLGDPGVIAIRTRLQTSEGGKTSGPMVVVDVSRRSQDGIFVTVSPMVRIRNASGLPLELKCKREEQGEEGAVVVLEDGDIIDDSMGSFDAINLEGELKKALSSLNLGKYCLSIRPLGASSTEGRKESEEDAKATHDWSEDVKGAKPVRVSGLFDKLQYSFNKTVKAQNLNMTFGVLFCPTKVKSSKKSSRSGKNAGLYFLIRTTHRKVPLIRPKSEKEQEQHAGRYSVVAWQQQQELLLLPTVCVLNLMTSNISITLTSTPEGMKKKSSSNADELQYCAAIQSLGRESMYIDLRDLVLTVKHEDLDLVSKPVSLGGGSKEFSRNTKAGSLRDIEMEVDFGDGIHTALVTVSRGEDGVLEVVILTRYALKNDSNVTLLCCSSRPHSSRWGGLRSSRNQELDWPTSGIVATVAPKSTISWFDRSTKLLVKRDEADAQPALLDLESVSGSMEVSLSVLGHDSMDNRIQLGVQLLAPSAGDSNPSCIIRLAPRYIVANDSGEAIVVCQDGFQDDNSAMVYLGPGERSSLHAQVLPDEKDKKQPMNSEAGPELLLTVRFRPKETGWDWSGPVCAAALGSFSIKIRRPQEEELYQKPQKEGPWFAVADVKEEAPSLIITFRQQAADAIPYRIENALRSGSIAYNQKCLDKSEIIAAGATVGYVWDDLGEPHILAVKHAGTSLQNDINPDKLRSWKSFRSSRRKGGLLQIPFLNDLSSMAMYGDDDDDLPTDSRLPAIGYEVYADGPARVVRICEEKDSRVDRQWQSETSTPKTEIEVRIPLFTISIVEPGKQAPDTENEEDDSSKPVAYVPIICLRLTNGLIEALVTPAYTLFQIKAERLDVDVKWQGAPLAAMLRGHGQDRFEKGHTVFHMAVVMSNLAKDPLQLKYASFLLQAMDLNIDEDTLMKLAPFYRSSLSESTAPSLQIYFERFEIHPIKIVGSFLPGNPHADYSSGQETLRALLHSVIKIPTVRGTTVELNGVLLSNALLTFKQLALKCAQHYSWYSMRAIYIARGSKLLPPGFASLFDDSAASSLDVFFDPASGAIDLQGLTLGMFGMLSRGLRKKGKGGTQRYLGDLQHTVKAAGSNLVFAVVTEVSDSVLKGADASGFDGLLGGFRRGVLNVAMKPSVLRGAVVQGGSTRRIKLDRIVGTDEAYIEGYLQAMLDALFKQNYLRVKVIDDQVILKNLPPNTTLMEEIVHCVRNFLIGEGLLAGESSAAALSSLRRLRGEDDRRLGPTVIALCEQLLVIIVVRALRRQTVRVLRQHHVPFIGDDQSEKPEPSKAVEEDAPKEQQNQGFFQGINFKRAITGFAISSVLAYADGRICRHIPNPLVRRVVSGFLLSFVE